MQPTETTTWPPAVQPTETTTWSAGGATDRDDDMAAGGATDRDDDMAAGGATDRDDDMAAAEFPVQVCGATDRDDDMAAADAVAASPSQTTMTTNFQPPPQGRGTRSGTAFTAISVSAAASDGPPAVPLPSSSSSNLSNDT